ncbi:disks large-associated protein 5-like [Penaeus japonicus]|uniref:disks large-associated protein 5-like n=1 Tax=Penaeus japonicus TaxID=27405 RepID=UPI001C716525|nr:disks large-associated protein 5-like [Penaeus japonicus]XP_042879396.1 disks large-associated protein 5-like [Penaeus japonicus]
MDANSELSVTYFRSLVESETQVLKGFSNEWNTVAKSSSDIPEDILGDIMVAVGQAELLMKERFSQFSGLIDDCEFSRGEKTITCQDLQGFWDIVNFQIQDIIQKFGKLSELKSNSWKKPEVQPQVKTLKKKICGIKPIATKTSAMKPKPGGGIRAHILAARQKMLAERNEIKAVEENLKPVDSEVRCVLTKVEPAQENNSVCQQTIRSKKCKTPVKIRTQEDDGNKENALGISPEKTVFDAGFFRVETPIKKASLTTPPLEERAITPGKTEQKLLSSAVLRERIANSPKVHKDYSPCMRITRSMKTKGVEPINFNLHL